MPEFCMELSTLNKFKVSFNKHVTKFWQIWPSGLGGEDVKSNCWWTPACTHECMHNRQKEITKAYPVHSTGELKKGLVTLSEFDLGTTLGTSLHSMVTLQLWLHIGSSGDATQTRKWTVDLPYKYTSRQSLHSSHVVASPHSLQHVPGPSLQYTPENKHMYQLPVLGANFKHYRLSSLYLFILCLHIFFKTNHK